VSYNYVPNLLFTEMREKALGQVAPCRPLLATILDHWLPPSLLGQVYYPQLVHGRRQGLGCSPVVIFDVHRCTVVEEKLLPTAYVIGRLFVDVMKQCPSRF
jgi:hypothetical protein